MVELKRNDLGGLIAPLEWIGAHQRAAGFKVTEQSLKNWIESCGTDAQPLPEYRYLGDRYTDPELVGALCSAIRRKDGKCICGRNATMLVQFESGRVANVLRRRLRKIKN